MQLPEDFKRETRLVMGDERFNRFMGAFDEEPPVSIRLNPRRHIPHSTFHIPHSTFHIPQSQASFGSLCCSWWKIYRSAQRIA